MCNPSSDIDMHAIDREGNTPLHVAAMKGQEGTVRVLCVMGARAGEKRAGDGRTAAQLAKMDDQEIPREQGKGGYDCELARAVLRRQALLRISSRMSGATTQLLQYQHKPTPASSPDHSPISQSP